MSVLIRGMEMPKSCDECPLYTCMHNHDNCPLAPVPAHGRLADADEMKKSIRKQTAFLRLIGGEFAEIAEVLEKGFLQEIDNAPTIIPAEPAEEEMK